MKLLSSISSHWRAALCGAGLAMLAGLLFLWVPQLDFLVNLSYDLGFLFRSPRPVSDVTIVYMDEASHKNLHTGWYDGWDRSLHARLIQKLTEQQCKAIAFDLLFLDTTTAAADEALVRAAKNSGKVFVATRMVAQVHQGEVIGFKMSTPFDALREVARIGAVEEADGDISIRRQYANRLHDQPSLSWTVAQAAGAASLPDPYSERWLNYYGPPGTIQNVSYHEVLEHSDKLGEMFSNKVVYVGTRYDVGFTGGKGTDDFVTPYTRWTGRRSPGVEVNATAYLNLVRGDWLSRPLPVWESLLIALAGLLFGGGLVLLSPTRATLVGLVGAVVFAGVLLMLQWQTFKFVPWMIICGLQIPLAIGWSVLTQTRLLHREKRSLEQMVAILSRGSMKADESSEEQPAYQNLRQTLAPASPMGEVLPVTENDTAGPVGPFIPDHELIRCVGKGGYGEVWLAKNILGNYQAVKILYRSKFKDSRPLEREFNGLKKFTPISHGHPNFVNILHVGRHAEPEYIYYVMEMADDDSDAGPLNPATYKARTLASELQRRRRFSLTECLQIAVPLTQALEFLHQNELIHRDIKPANILFVKGVPKLADVGLVTSFDSAGSSITYVGTPGRIAPEGPTNPASDIFSLGKLLYEIGTGLPIERYPELPTALVEAEEEEGFLLLNRIILKACDFNVRQRYQDASELMADLQDLERKLHAGSR